MSRARRPRAPRQDRVCPPRGDGSGTGRGIDGDPAGELGVVAGAEALAFGVLIFVLGTLLIVNTWAVVDARFATAAAAREAVRAAVETPVGQDPLEQARRAAGVALDGHGIDPATAQVVPIDDLRLARCEELAIRVTLEVDALVLPGIERRIAAFTVTGEHREVVDPFRSGLEVAGACAF